MLSSAIPSHFRDGQEAAYEELDNNKDTTDVDAMLKVSYQRIFPCTT
jgi:hypothetical protein